MVEKNYTVYMHINKVNGKKYIGITKQKIENRWGARQYKSCVLFNIAIEKYGWNNFEHIVIATSLSKEEAEQMEVELIAKYDTTNRNYGYNILKGGNGNKGHKLSCGQKLKISYYTRKALDGKSPYNKGLSLSEETKKKISESRKCKCCGSDNHNYGKEMSKETKDKLSKSLKEYWAVHEHPNKGKQLSEERIKKMSESRKGKFLGKDNKMSKKVLQIDLLSGDIISEYDGVNDAARATGAIASKISACCLGKRKSHMGYAWYHKDKYVKEKEAA